MKAQSRRYLFINHLFSSWKARENVKMWNACAVSSLYGEMPFYDVDSNAVGETWHLKTSGEMASISVHKALVKSFYKA